MSLVNRIKKLEEKLLLKTSKTYWLMWKDCQWNESEGLIRKQYESTQDFKKRVLSTVNKKFIWVK